MSTYPAPPTPHLWEAAESLLDFNRMSGSAVEGWEYPPASAYALAALSKVSSRLGKAVEQSIVPVLSTHEYDRVRVDGDGDPDVKVAELVAAREDAVTAAAELAAAVERMHATAFLLGLDTRGMPAFQDDEPHRD